MCLVLVRGIFLIRRASRYELLFIDVIHGQGVIRQRGLCAGKQCIGLVPKGLFIGQPKVATGDN